MERFTTDTPQGNTSFALNLFYIKDGETWVRGGGPEPDYLDVRLYDYIREVAETLKADIDDGLSDDDLGEYLYELLADGNGTMEGVVATLYTAAWAFSSLRAKLADYEDTGLEPEGIIVYQDIGLTPSELSEHAYKLQTYNQIYAELTSMKEAEQKRREAENKVLNPAGEYAVKFAENHGISIAEAMEKPMVKARFAYFADTGM